MDHLSAISDQGSKAGFWEWDIVGKSIKNPILLASLGYSEGELSDSVDVWRSMVHPEDWGRMTAAFEKHGTNNPQGPLVEEIRFFRKNGDIVSILFVGKVTGFDADGRALKMVGSHVDITSQKEREKNLERVNSLLNETSRIAKVGGWEFEMASGKAYWADYTKDIFEVDRDFVPRRGVVAELFAEKADHERLNSTFGFAIETRSSFDIEFPVTTAKGNRKWIRCTGQPAFEANECVRLFGVFQDITEKQRAKEALLMKEQQLSTFIKYSPVAICMMDTHLNYIAASDIWKAFFDLGEEDVRGKNQLEIFPQTPEVWRNRYKRALAGEVLRMDEDIFMLEGGGVEWLEWEIRPWYEAPEQIGGIIVFTAIISEKHAVKEALIEAKNQAEQASLMKSKFLSVMSHEMRTPLNAVIGFINLLMQSPRPDQVEYMNVLRFSAENLLVLINDVLDFSRLDADQVQLEEREFNLDQLLNNIVATLAHEASTRKLELKLATDPSIPGTLIGDARRLGQILINLINNALKFTHEGGVEVTCRLKENHGDGVTIGFEIKDTGIGIPAEQHERIFDMFSQADSDTNRKYGGAGLGLSISKRLLELMGSEIHLSSSPSHGSTFSFAVVFRVNSAAGNAEKDKEADTQAEILAGAEILIVEDNPVNVLLMKKFLGQFHCKYSVATDGRIACEMVTNHDYDLILMDLQMPEMDGYMATRYIRSLPDEKYRHLPIIALSATDKAEIDTKLHQAGLTDFVSKPFVPAELTALLVQHLDKNGQRAGNLL